MKITTLILLMALMQVSAASVAQRITFVKKNASLEQVFQEITRQTGYEVFYGDKKFDDSRKISVAFKDATLDEVLKTCLQKQRASYVIEEKSIIIKPATEPFFLDRLADRWAAIDVHGRVVDQEGKPLPGATVKVKGTGKSVSTNAKGEFYHEKIEEDAVLVISFIGYVSKEVTVEKELGSIILELSDSKLDEVQVIAYGETTRRLSTGNISTVKAADIEKQPIDNPLLAMQGRIPGIVITQESGVPGSGVKVQIRGQNSLENGNDPLYIIDGVPYVSNLLRQSGEAIIGKGSPFSFLNPASIESIDVLKDADATAIYGSRGANGVIIVTTKKGKAGETRFDINSSHGVGKITRKLKLLNTQQYLEMRKEAFKNDGVLTIPDGAFDLTKWDQNRYTDWQKELIGGSSSFTNVQTSLNGGNNTTQFLIGGGYNRQTTVFPGDFSVNRGSALFNINHTSPNNKMHAMLSGNYLADQTKLFSVDLTSFMTLPPNAPALLSPDGSVNWEQGTFYQNPLWRVYDKNNFRTKNLITSGLFSYNIIKGLEIKSSFGYNNLQVDQLQTSPIAAIQSYPGIGNPTGSSDVVNNNVRSWSIEPQLNYRLSTIKGKLDFLLGATFQENASQGLSINASGITSDALLENIEAAPKVKVNYSSKTLYRYNSLFARINYNYSDKYIANLTGRRDGSSRFGPERRFGDFGAVGLAWIFTNESFLKERVPLMSYGKLRGSYGTSGNDQIGDYRFVDLYTPRQYPKNYQGVVGLSPANLYNPELAWEVNRKFEIGLDLGFFKDRLILSGIFYKNRSSNQLISYPLPISVGFNSVPANLPATVQNTGFEYSVNSTNVKSNEFTWSSSVNITIPKNKLVAYPGLKESSYGNYYIEGKSLSIQRLYHMVGVDPETGQYQFQKKDGSLTFDPDYGQDRTVELDIAPKFYGGIQNSFAFKGLQIDLNIQFVKQKGLNFLYNPLPGSSTENQPTTVLDRWQKVGDITNIQRYNQNFSLQKAYEYARVSDQAYGDASFIRLKNLSISYQVPYIFKERLKLSNCRIFVQGQNLFTITKFKGIDPENQSSKVLPPLKVLTAGIQVTF